MDCKNLSGLLLTQIYFCAVVVRPFHSDNIAAALSCIEQEQKRKPQRGSRHLQKSLLYGGWPRFVRQFCFIVLLGLESRIGSTSSTARGKSLAEFPQRRDEPEMHIGCRRSAFARH